jgi:serine/threonine protein kinase
VPDYALLRCIGRGGYGEVWLARSTATGVLRAAKIVWRQGFEDDRPFRREFEGLQHFERLSREHPSQLALFHIGWSQLGDYFYYVMELADNFSADREVVNAEPDPPGTSSPHSVPPIPDSYTSHTLRAELNHGRLHIDRVLEVGLALTEALGHLHENGLVHRDVKPSNVIFVNGRPKLADIGLVTDASDTLSVVGTEGYLPPDGPGTPHADLFALGKVLYEAATGLDRRRFPQLPPDLGDWPEAEQVFEINEILLKACAQSARERYGNAKAMHADLVLLGEGKSIRQKRTRQQLRSLSKKAALASLILAVVVVNLMLAVGHFTRSRSLTDGPPSTNTVATALCAKGMLIIRGDNFVEFAEAYTNFHQAIALDAHFAQPYAGLLELRVRESVPTLPPTTSEELRDITTKLGQLAPNSAAAYCAQSIVSFYDWDFPRAQECALRSIKSDPEYELGHTSYGFMLTYWGRPAEGRAQLNISQLLAPSKVTIYRMLAHTYYAEHDYTNAIAGYRTTLGWESHHSPAYEFLGQCYLALGDYVNAITNFEAADLLSTNNELETKRRYDAFLHAFRDGGVRGYWQARWTETEKDLNSDFYWKAVVRIHLGDPDAALTWLSRSYETHELDSGFQTPLISLVFDHWWEGLRDEPRFKKLLEKLSFTKVMPAR